MIEFTESAYKRDERVFFTCPDCGAKNIIILISPDKCYSCRKPLPDIKDIFNGGISRAKYYRNKKSRIIG